MMDYDERDVESDYFYESFNKSLRFQHDKAKKSTSLIQSNQGPNFDSSDYIVRTSESKICEFAHVSLNFEEEHFHRFKTNLATSDNWSVGGFVSFDRGE